MVAIDILWSLAKGLITDSVWVVTLSAINYIIIKKISIGFGNVDILLILIKTQEDFVARRTIASSL